MSEQVTNWIEAIRFAAESVDNLARTLVGNTKTDGTRDSIVYEQGIGCERAGKMLREIAELIERSGEIPIPPQSHVHSSLCRLCGKSAHQIKGYLKRMNETGINGIWECRPSCDAKLTREEAILAALED